MTKKAAANAGGKKNARELVGIDEIDFPWKARLRQRGGRGQTMVQAEKPATVHLRSTRRRRPLEPPPVVAVAPAVATVSSTANITTTTTNITQTTNATKTAPRALRPRKRTRPVDEDEDEEDDDHDDDEADEYRPRKKKARKPTANGRKTVLRAEARQKSTTSRKTREPSPRQVPTTTSTTTTRPTHPTTRPTRPASSHATARHQREASRPPSEKTTGLVSGRGDALVGWDIDDFSYGQRRLRSHTGRTRIKSELSLFFPNYEDTINDLCSEPESLLSDAEMRVAEEAGTPAPSTPPAATQPPAPSGPVSASDPAPAPSSHVVARPSLPDTTITSSGVQQLDFSSVGRGGTPDDDDPWTDLVFAKAHQRSERREKQLRNIEKNKAQHEKDHLERLLEGLQGSDWLRVMGISGITASEKKRYEGKRAFFIGEVTALIEKFRVWREEEKRLREESRRARPNARPRPPPMAADRKHKRANAHEGDEVAREGSDVDAGAARQLHHEATLATEGISRPPATKRARGPAKVVEASVADEPPVKSLFSKAYQRRAALGHHRRSERNALAFGQPIPEMPEGEFDLPDDILSSNTIAARARARRRLNRAAQVP